MVRDGKSVAIQARRLSHAFPVTVYQSRSISHSENSQSKPRRHRRAGFRASLEIVGAYGLRRQYRFGRLGVRADDDRLGDAFEPPAGRDALDLAHRVLA